MLRKYKIWIKRVLLLLGVVILILIERRILPMEMFFLLKYLTHRRISLSNILEVILLKLTKIELLSPKNLIMLATRISLNFLKNQRFLRSSFQIAQIIADQRKTNLKNPQTTTIPEATRLSISRNCFIYVLETYFWIFFPVATSRKRKSAQLALSKSRHK